METENNHRSMTVWRWVFGAAALWTTIGAVPGYFDPAGTFARFYGVEPSSQLMVQIYRGAWGQSFLFALGYLLAAFAPVRYAAIVGLGMIGKTFYAVGLLGAVISGSAGPIAGLAVAGDLLFAAAFGTFLLSAGVLRGLANDAALGSSGSLATVRS